MLTNPFPNNQNMNSRTIDPHCAWGGDQNPSEANSGHGCVNMVRATKVVTHAKDMVHHNRNLEKNPLHLGALCVSKNIQINLKLHLTFLRES